MKKSKLVTEGRNSRSENIDRQSIEEILETINAEDQQVPLSIANHLQTIAEIVKTVVAQMKQGGRLLYVGAGTSGRIGVLDASEIPPTYGTSPELVQAIIAGGEQAVFRAVENVEDNEALGFEEIASRNITTADVVMGITASGGAPYVIGALKKAQELGAKTIAFTNNQNAPLHQYGDHVLAIDVGPEVVMGSTRMKAGTSQKLVLNMITTATMIQLGKVYENLMVDVQPLNKKLIERSKAMIQYATSCDEQQADRLFLLSGRKPKVAIIMGLLHVSKDEAEQLLVKNDGYIYRVVDDKY
ncbi:N-acetylmuramic acid 6-phosphate etherase [Geomicrobium sediminis]|uniref:N-acetylmuramic acid 6-phosphate etherase n=1 Tax=Geomicrobium sediminis TaxID=1347788 RepID=A0ABS2PDV8_9BACL|nr:N-acetylmuramic acid 6-phosphate etherase [Geomicrobium sediminis]MBM7633316.1 N-acetylmuramic acid 6-phosphate etherase [Geomicrobium sediminis]